MQTAEADRARSARPADRLLAAATDLFGKYGIRAVGVDRILREADCAKASLYSAFGSKDALVIAYLTELDAADRNGYARVIEGVTDPVVKALTFFDLAQTKGLRHDFPGLPLHAAPLPNSPACVSNPSMPTGNGSGPR